MLCMVSFAVLRFLGLIMSHLFLLFIYFFIFGFSGSSLLCASFLLLPQGGASFHCSEQWLLRCVRHCVNRFHDSTTNKNPALGHLEVCPV